ncbi:hypothetical protein BP5796_05484 [Coleophoma crateriformis]|uniref:Carboxylesterase type B domain-containing protein n=1 Tax=Coleophoma crateriformis TaxID=565419 RepID=A0A3D8S3F1_9HELO|nr:hypothetical protein BP5796_05484 [Coleophoma crateriformis]
MIGHDREGCRTTLDVEGKEVTAHDEEGKASLLDGRQMIGLHEADHPPEADVDGGREQGRWEQDEGVMDDIGHDFVGVVGGGGTRDVADTFHYPPSASRTALQDRRRRPTETADHKSGTEPAAGAEHFPGQRSAHSSPQQRGDGRPGDAGGIHPEIIGAMDGFELRHDGRSTQGQMINWDNGVKYLQDRRNEDGQRRELDGLRVQLQFSWLHHRWHLGTMFALAYIRSIDAVVDSQPSLLPLLQGTFGYLHDDKSIIDDALHSYLGTRCGSECGRLLPFLAGRGSRIFGPSSDLQSSKLYNFSNIQYANAPRFGAPTRVTTVNRTTSDGQSRGVCPTALPYWQTLLPACLASLETVAQINSSFLEVFNGIEANSTSVAAKLVTEPVATQTEDCLLLDVVVPQTIMNKTLRGEKATGEFTSRVLLIARMLVLDVDHNVAPVMVWIVGGGFVIGDKNAAGDPTGLIQQSMSNSSDGVIYVTLNYRLGLFGFMSGPEYTAQGGVSNLGFRDQRFALAWVQENIYLFGGDRTQVTVFGESGGGSSIMHQITAYGSTSGAPFQRVIIQSPAFQVMPQNSTQDSRFQKALQWASILSNGSAITTLDQLKALPFDILNKVNQVTVSGSYWGAFTWGPAIDGTFIPDLPGVLLANGKSDQSVQVIAAHNSDEAHLFASPLVTSQDEFTTYIKLLLPEASDDVITYLNTVLYPPNYNGSYSYTTQLGRTTAFINDSWFVCNTRYIDRAFNSPHMGIISMWDWAGMVMTSLIPISMV